jgi:hypothetical protein
MSRRCGSLLLRARSDTRAVHGPPDPSSSGSTVLTTRALQTRGGVPVATQADVSPRGRRLWHRKYEFDHYISGLIVLAGVLAVGAGSVLPWVKVSGPSLTVLGLDLHPRLTVGGLTDGGAYVLAGDVVVLILGVLLMGTHRRRGLILRLLLIACGAAAAGLGIDLIAKADDFYASAVSSSGTTAATILNALGQSSVPVDPDAGAYLLALGGALTAIGALVPWRRRSIQSA